MKFVLHILLLFLLTQATTFAQVDSTANAQALADSIAVEKSTSDTTTEVVGKLSLVTFEPKEINICLVPVNDVSLPGIQKLEKELNDIFRPAVASVRLSTAPSVKIQYADGRNFVHGGSGPLSVYSADEKSAIRALGTQQSDTYYLFMAKDVVKLDPDGNRTIVGGYMPVGRQFGFIFEQFDVASTIAHEVSHGAPDSHRDALHHTFSDESESYHAPQGTTPNLMDYSGGTTLNHLQWQWMHESHTNLLGFLDDESEGEAIALLVSYGINVVLNASVQMLFAYMFDDAVNSWEDAWEEVSMWQALADGIVDIIPIKKVRYALSFANNFVQCLAPKEHITSESFVECGLLGLVDIVAGDAIDKYGLPAVKKGLQKIGIGSEKIDDVIKNAYSNDLPPSDIAGIDANSIKQNTANVVQKVKLNWVAFIGKNIDELEDAPIGYQFYYYNGKKFIRRVNASDVNTPQLTVKEGKIVKYDGKVIESFTNEQIADIVKTATKNPNSNKVMLGRFDSDLSKISYNRASGNDYTYFELNNWDGLIHLVNENEKEMWRLNKQFLYEQFSQKKRFLFLSRPIFSRIHIIFQLES